MGINVAHLSINYKIQPILYSIIIINNYYNITKMRMTSISKQKVNTIIKLCYLVLIYIYINDKYLIPGNQHKF